MLSGKNIFIVSQRIAKALVEDSIILEIPPGFLSKDKIQFINKWFSLYYGKYF